MASAALSRALYQPGDPPLRPLPEPVAELLGALDAPPRLAAHLRAVHDVAWRLTADLARLAPALTFNRHSVLFGAATHDIGKIRHPIELTGPGTAHEEAGYRLLMQYGVPDVLARFTRTHSAWTGHERPIEDLLVSLADKVWKGRRVLDLEQLVADRIATATDRPPGMVFDELDGVISRVAADADRLLAYQAGHPLRG